MSEIIRAAELLEFVESTDRELLPELAGALGNALAECLVRIGSADLPEPQAPVRLVTAEEVADRLSMGTKWVYEHQTELGACQLSAGAVRFCLEAVSEYVEANMKNGRKPCR